MNRCKICDVLYYSDHSNRFLDEDYCPMCAGAISLCLEELEDYEEPQTYGCEEEDDG